MQSPGHRLKSYVRLILVSCSMGKLSSSTFRENVIATRFSEIWATYERLICVQITEATVRRCSLK